MTDWTDGYVADIGYTFGYYAELNPLRSQLAFLNSGLEPPVVNNACELGFGQGVSVNLHAAGSVSTAWYGTDFNPSQAGFAQSLAKASGANAHLFDSAFDDFCRSDDLPQFDFISLHGIWSWISDENRHVIVDFIRRKLSVGGVLYISYNTLPGWAAAAPLRELMTQHSNTMSAAGIGVLARVENSLDFVQKLFDTKPLYTLANSHIAERFDKIKVQDKNYLAHEYFNKDWQPMYYSEMASWLEPAKLSFACSSNYLDHVNEVNLNEQQQKLLASIPDLDFRQTIRDFIVNQQFRKDYWVKGPRRLDPLRQAEALRAHRVILTTNRADVPLKMQGVRGEVNLTEHIYSPILDLLSDYKPHSVGEIEAKLVGSAINLQLLVQSLIVLAGMGHVYSVQSEDSIKSSQRACEKVNQDILMRSRSVSELGYLSSPVIGGGFSISRFHQLFIMAIQHGKKQPIDWARFAWEILRAQGQAILKEGQALQTPDENIAELEKQAIQFSEKQLPILRGLHIL